MNTIDQVRQRLAALNGATGRGPQGERPIAGGNRQASAPQRPPQAVKTAKGVVEG